MNVFAGPRPGRSAMWLGVLIVLTQRLGLPVAGVAVPVGPLLLLLAFLSYWRHGILVLDIRRNLIFICFAVIGVVGLLRNPEASPTSLAQVLLFWAPVAFTVVAARKESSPGLADMFLRGMVLTTVIASILSVFQLTVSVATGKFVDPISLLPEAILVQGYNTTYAVSQSTDWTKPNGMVFLEPSLLSLFAVLSLVVLVSSKPALTTSKAALAGSGVLVLGVVSSVAISGLVLLPALVVAARTRFKAVLAFVVGMSTLLVLTPRTEVLAAFVNRASGGIESGSNQARLVRPYTELLPHAVDSLFLGAGPGLARDLADRLTTSWTDEVTTPTLVKLVVEYGVVGVLLFVLVVVNLFVSSTLSFSSKLALFVAMFVPTDGLTSGVLVPAFIGALVLSARVSNDMAAERAVAGNLAIHRAVGEKPLRSTLPRKNVTLNMESVGRRTRADSL